MIMYIYHTYRIKYPKGKGKNQYMKITDERLEQILLSRICSFRRLNPIEYLIEYIYIRVFSYPVLLINDWLWKVGIKK